MSKTSVSGIIFKNMFISSNGTNRDKVNRIPLLLKVIFLVSQLCFGVNFGFTPVLRQRYWKSVKIFTLVVSIANIAIVTGPVIHMYNDAWVWFNCIKYILFFIVLNNLKYTVYNLIVDVNKICNIKTIQKIFIYGLVIGMAIIVNGIKVLFMGIRCACEIKPYCSRFGMPLYIFYDLTVLSLDVIGVTQAIIYYYIKCCVENIREFLKEGNTKMNLKMFDKRYIAVTECCKKIRPLYDAMIILQLGIMVPKLMATIMSILIYFKDNAAWYSYMTEIVFAFHLTIQICTPAIVVEMVNSEVDSIKEMLKEKLLKETDERTISDVMFTLQIVETKSLNHLVLRFIPIDIRMLLSLFSLCTTYFIVILQFTHLYD